MPSLKLFEEELVQNRTAKPFLKWAGGKTQLLGEIEENLPDLVTKNSFTYIEPFVGGGAVLFWMLSKFDNIEKAIINDVNTDLTNTYKSIKENIDELIDQLYSIQTDYYSTLSNDDLKKEFYLNKRELFNRRNSNPVTQSALLIFLNRTCFNGLYRVNKKNLFNVPLGNYKKPTICNEDNLRAVSKLLRNVEILNGDYSETKKYIGQNTLFYFDPPYKPLNKTSSFNSYAKDFFGDKEQIRLRNFCKEIDELGCKWMLSNSDMKNTDPDDNFFDELYQEYIIKRVYASRQINSKSTKRGKLTELLIKN